MVDKSEKQQQPYKVLGINATKNYAQYAKKIEQGLNKMKEDGYALRVVNITEKGALICGEFISPNQNPFRSNLRVVPLSVPGAQLAGGRDEDAPEPTHPDTANICNFIVSAMENAPAAEYKNILTKIAPRFCQNKMAHELLTIADDIERQATYHSTHHHDPADTCVIPAIFNATAEYLRSIGRPGIN